MELRDKHILRNQVMIMEALCMLLHDSEACGAENFRKDLYQQAKKTRYVFREEFE